MRAFLLCLALAACAPEPEPEVRRVAWGLEDPIRDPADNIAEIGAQAMCAEGERPVTERQETASVTYCERP